MELVFTIRSTRQHVSANAWQRTFTQVGGMIGRAQDCKWTLPDQKRHLSNHHASITYQDGEFFLTDVSSNGVVDAASGARLKKGEATRISDGSVFALGDFEICAQLVPTSPPVVDDACPEPASNIIPDDSFLEFDALGPVSEDAHLRAEIDDLMSPRKAYLDTARRADFAPIETESLTVPMLVAPEPVKPPVAPAKAVEVQSDGFWGQFADALGVSMDELDRDAKEALALNAARLFKQSIDGLLQSLRTRSELKNELRLAQTTLQGAHKNPLKYAADSSEAIAMLVHPLKSGQPLAEQTISRAFRDLQAHQVALLAGSRAAVRGALEHFSPQRLTLRFERDHKPFFATSAARWKAYVRYHQALCQDDDWSERLLARDFAHAYEEQLRLISTLHTHQG